ncbi:hypothetical protein [Fibrella aquatica]|jgi:hypothetical protein
MKKVVMLASAVLLLSMGACARKGVCPAYGAAKAKPAVTRAA